MNLKIGGNNVGKIMYNGQEFGGATKLEPGTILYMSSSSEKIIKNVHLFNTTKNWNNLNGINVALYSSFTNKYGDTDISGDDFKNLDIAKKYYIGSYEPTVSRSIVDGEYRLNVDNAASYFFIIKVI